MDDEMLIRLEMESKIFSDDINVNSIEISDPHFFCQGMLFLIRYRPLKIDEVIEKICSYNNGDEYSISVRENIRYLLIKKCFPAIYKLYSRGYFCLNEISGMIKESKNLNFAQMFYKVLPEHYNDSCAIHDDVLLYGFEKGSMEFSLKYDEVDQIDNFVASPSFRINHKCKWSEYEWSKKPYQLDMLSFSAHFGSIHCFKKLLALGALVNDFTIFAAAFGGNLDILHLCPNNKHYLLHRYITKLCRIDILRWVESQSNFSIHHFKSPSSEILLHLIEKMGLFIAFYSTITPILVAAKNGNIPLLKHLDKSISGKNYNWGRDLAIFLAVQSNRIDVVQYFVDKGLSVNQQLISYGMSPLHTAVKISSVQVVRYLLSKGANVNAQDKYTATYFFWMPLFITPFSIQQLKY